MKIERATDALAEELGRYPTPAEIAERLDNRGEQADGATKAAA